MDNEEVKDKPTRNVRFKDNPEEAQTTNIIKDNVSDSNKSASPFDLK
jgi:hypothetical protein